LSLRNWILLLELEYDRVKFHGTCVFPKVDPQKKCSNPTTPSNKNAIPTTPSTRFDDLGTGGAWV